MGWQARYRRRQAFRLFAAGYVAMPDRWYPSRRALHAAGIRLFHIQSTDYLPGWCIDLFGWGKVRNTGSEQELIEELRACRRSLVYRRALEAEARLSAPEYGEGLASLYMRNMHQLGLAAGASLNASVATKLAKAYNP